jgi:hypothetical protein
VVNGNEQAFLSIRGKRRSVSVSRLKHKYRVGDYGNGHRALVRCGKGSTDVLIGKDDLSEWDEEELRRGRKRDKDGGWRGRDPVIVPKAIHDELVKRTLNKANKMLIDNLENAVVVLTELVMDPKVDAKDRVKAIDMIMNRAMGREPQKLEVKGEAKWQAAITHSIVSLPAELVDPNIDNRDEENDDDEHPFK